MAQGGLIFALFFGLIAVSTAALNGSPGTCGAPCTGWCDLSNNCCTLPSNCASANCANSTACTKTVCTGCAANYALDAITKGCCSLPIATGMTTSYCATATCDANGANVKCTACVVGYFLSNGACVVCTQPRCTTVATCDAAGAGTGCTTTGCASGNVRATDGKCCTAVANCATLTTCTAADGSAGTCTLCNAGYILIGNVCTICPQNANCLTGQTNLKCAVVAGAAGPSMCTACPLGPATNIILSAAGECCNLDNLKNCGTYVAAVGNTPATFGYKSCTTAPTGNVLCASCKTSTSSPVTGATDGAAYLLDAVAGTCTECSQVAAGTNVYEHDATGLCATWGCTKTDDVSTNICLSCPLTGNTAMTGDKTKCGPPIAGCAEITTVDVKSTGVVPIRTAITAYSRCGTLATPKCMPGFVYVAGAAVDQVTPTSDACTACTVPSANTNCLTGSCTALPSTGFVCLTCSPGYFLAAGVCTIYTPCVAGSTYLTTAGTATANQVCSPCSSCGTGTFSAKTCTVTTDTVCGPCKVPCDNCATSTCLGGCNTCTNNYVFTSTVTVCELACGNGKLNNGEQCDETVSGQCVNCQCNAGFFPSASGVCTDIDECTVYTCALNSDENVECSADEPNMRTCSCIKEGKFVRSSTETSATLEGREYFNGCQDADVSEKDFVANLVDSPAPIAWLFEVLGGSVDNFEVDSEDALMFSFTLTFADGSALTTAEVASTFKTWLFDLYGIALADSDVTVVEADGVYGVAVSISETATDSAATFAPIMSVVAVLLMLIR